MNPTEAYQARPNSAPAAATPLRADDSGVSRAVEEYLALAAQGRPPNRQEFLARYPELAPVLEECLGALDFLQSAAPQLGQAATSPAAADEELHPTAALGDFRLLRELGRGGMGVVYEAEQLSLGRRVALKVLPFASALDAKQLQRFKNEAHAAAQLHHTHIVPVYYVGVERGVHFYAMQLIEGQTLAQLIAALQRQEQPAQDDGSQPAGLPDAPTAPQAALSTERSANRPAFYRTAARLGIQAAEALEHAHQLGVVHRDIKPGNLMLDGRGHLWVTDFGLAQFQADQHLTLTGDLLGTLRYMSPEQALAQRVVVDHRTDVYSLGVTLYELLTLRPVYAGRDRQEIMRQIAFDEPVPPRRVSKAIPAELETIVLKAMAKAPQERYASARELADDLGRFLEDRPIRARRPGPAQRLGKWARRHRAPVGGVAAALAVGLVVAVAVLGVKNRELTAANEREREARTEAEKARESAEERFALAQGAVDQYLNRVTDDPDLKDRHGLHELRKRLLQAAVPFYQKLAKEKPGDDKQEAARGRAFGRLGNLRRQLGETEAALADFHEMRVIFGKLSSDHPAVPQYRQALASSHNYLGVQMAELGKRAEAEAECRAALKERERLAVEHPAVLQYRQDLANSHNSLGVVLAGLGKRAEAEAEYRAALKEQEWLAAEHPAEPRYATDLGGSYCNLGELTSGAGHPAQAIDWYAKAITALEQAFRQGPDPTVCKFLCNSHDGRGRALAGSGRYSEAEAEIRAALKERERLAAEHPALPQYRQDLAASHNNLGQMLEVLLGKRAEAEAEYRAALKERERLAVEHPAVPQYRHDLAKIHKILGALLAELGKRAEAEAEYRAALKEQERLVAEHPAVPRYATDLGGSYCNFGVLMAKVGHLPQALDWFTKAIATLDGALRRFDSDATAREFLRNSHANRARALTLLEQHAQAIQDWDRALALDPGPMRPTYRLPRAVNIGLLGEEKKALAEIDAILQIGSDDNALLYNAACAFAVWASKAGDSDRAERYATRAIALLRDAIGKGYGDTAHLKTDRDLDGLRGRADFQKLLADLEAAKAEP